MKKPTGTNGAFRIQINPDGTVSGSFMPITLPNSKAEVEQTIVNRFLASMNTHLKQAGERFFLSNPRINDENDFDFTVDSPRGIAFLELMEIAPLSGPYDKAPAQYNVYNFSKTIYQGITRKSKSYAQNMANDLFLLIYPTHWAFTPSRSAINCLRYWCASTSLAFRAVFYYQPLDEQEGAPHWIFPVPPELLNNFNPEQVRDNVFINLDPRNWDIDSNSA